MTSRTEEEQQQHLLAISFLRFPFWRFPVEDDTASKPLRVVRQQVRDNKLCDEAISKRTLLCHNRNKAPPFPKLAPQTVLEVTLVDVAETPGAGSSIIREGNPQTKTYCMNKQCLRHLLPFCGTTSRQQRIPRTQ
eukprot:GHVS01002769.1.p1 GENE.GHVS01002769.1~~GHVS01002769.1.p1  ORF type:complete len:135 (+),score=14.83 GHVS01002769.1:938-1342(+)